MVALRLHENGTNSLRQPTFDAPRITILMGVYNGAAYLRPQLDSFVRQSDRNWGLIVSIDQSRDSSDRLVEVFARTRFTQSLPIKVVEGPGKGFAANYLHLFRAAAATPNGDWLALSDQDDVWLPNKLERARQVLAGLDDVPAIYCSRTLVCDRNLQSQRPTRLFPRPPTFANALAQNIAAGNTIVMNARAKDIVTGAAAEVDEVVSHDWWIYQLITGAGGQVIYDPEPSLLYRQHGGNAVGENRTLPARWQRFKMVVDGTYRRWNRINIRALKSSSHRLTVEARSQLDAFDRAVNGRLTERLIGLWRSKLHRQTSVGTASIRLLIALGLV